MAAVTSSRIYVSTTVTTSTAKSITDLGFTAAQVKGASSLIVTCDTSDLRYRVDGTNPTSSVGHIIRLTVTTQFDEDFGVIKVIGRTATANVTAELVTHV
jgi:hypothetical protein